MSGGGPHVCDPPAPSVAPQPSPSNVESPGDLGVLGSVSVPPAPALVRGGATPPLDLALSTSSPALPSPALPLSVIEQFKPLEAGTAFFKFSSRLPPSERLIDPFGHGDCGFSGAGIGLAIMGAIFPAEGGDPLANVAANARYYGEVARAATVSHGRLFHTLSAVVRDSDAGGGVPVLFSQAIEASMAMWPNLAAALLALGLPDVSVESWLDAMRVNAAEDVSGTYADSAAMLLMADCYRCCLRCRTLDSEGEVVLTQHFLPRSGVEARFLIGLVNVPDLHFMLEVNVLASAAIPPPVATPLSSAYLASLVRVRELGEAFRLQQEADRAERLAAEARQRDAAEAMPPPPPRAPRPSSPIHGGDLSDAALSVAFADSLASEQAKQAASTANSSRDLAGEMAAIAAGVPEAEIRAQREQVSALEALPRKRARTGPVEENYTSACSVLFGVSVRFSQPVLLLVRSAFEPHGLGAISELREPADADAVRTALRGVAEELLGLLPGSDAVAVRATGFLGQLDASGFCARHLGTDPSATHRSFAFPADLLFESPVHSGIDLAFDSFRASDEVDQVVMVPLERLTGQPGETTVRCVHGMQWPLRDGRHLGAGRLRFIRRYIGHRSLLLARLPSPVVTLSTPQLFCTNCGAPVDESGVCPDCGERRPPSPPPSTPCARCGNAADTTMPCPDCSAWFCPDCHSPWAHDCPQLPPSERSLTGGELTADVTMVDVDVEAAVLQHDAQSAAWLAERRERDSFTWPLTTVEEVRRLLACEFIAPTDLVGFEFSGAVHDALVAAGRRVLTVDYRSCEHSGLHACMDVRAVLPLQRWSRVYLFPPCFQQLRADADCLQAKIADGRAFWGCALVLFCFCVDADLLVVEQPDTIVMDYVPASYTQFRTSQFGDSPDKFVRLFLRNCVLAPPFGPDPSVRRRPPHYLAYADSDERDRAKSSWRPLVNLSRAVARMLPIHEPAPMPASYADAVEQFAAAWHAAGHPVPRGYADSTATPPVGSRRYQRSRGPGDGRVVDAVVPARAAAVSRPVVRGGATEPPRDGTMPTHDIRSASEALVIVIFVSLLLQPLVYAHANGFTVHGVLLPEAEATPRPSYLRAVQPLVRAATGLANAAFLVGEYVNGARLAVVPLDFRPPPADIRGGRRRRPARTAAGAFAWFTLSALAGSAIYDAAARAVLACEAYVKPGHMLADFPSTELGGRLVFRCGAAPATSVLARPTLDGVNCPPAWRAVGQMMRDDGLLIHALNAASEDKLLSGWVDRIRPLDPSDIPPSLLAALPGFDDIGLEHQTFTPVYVPLRTDWLPLPPAQLPIPEGAPSCVRSPFEMMLPATQRLVSSWLRHTLQDLLRIRRAVADGEAASLVDGTMRRDRPQPIAVGREELHEWARDRVWDCRLECCRLLDFQASIETHLDLEYLRRRLVNYPDQHLVANVLEGARLDADVELQSVFVPHLVSLPLGYASVGKEVRRLHGLEWYKFFPDFPFWPLYLNGQGSTARKLEPDRFRRTTEGGGPRHPTFDLAGLLAWSINAASFVPHLPKHFLSDSRPAMREWLQRRRLWPPPTQVDSSLSKWPKETKPRLRHLLRDLAILKRASQMLGEPVYVIGDDFKDYFNQLAMAESELHKLNIVFLREPSEHDSLLDGLHGSAHVPFTSDGQLLFISERRLGFGTHGASNIAQRFSDALLHLFREDMDAADAPFFDQPSPAMSEWLAARERAAEKADSEAYEILGHVGDADETPADARRSHWLEQRRLYSCYVYSDDPVFLVVGVQRTLRALRVWRRLTTDAGLIMAIPEKRSLGTHAPWLGVLLVVGLGLVVVPKAKLLRAAGSISAVLKNGQPFHIYRSLIGLLEHLRDVNLHGRNVMHGLYEPHGAQGASRFGPSGRVECDSLMTKQLLRWQSLLRRSAGVSARAAFRREEVEPCGTFTVFACSDACFGDEDPAGMGGFCHGLFWTFVVPPADYDAVTTPLLEFLALAFNVLALPDHAEALCGDKGTLLLRTDALTSALVLPAESQHSPALIDAYQLLIETDAWRRLRGRLRVQHAYGDTQAVSDALSRSHMAVFRQRCRQLNVKPVRLSLPLEAIQLYRRVVSLVRARRLRHAAPAPIARGGGDRVSNSFLLALRSGAAAPGAPAPAPLAAAPARSRLPSSGDASIPASTPGPSFADRLRGSAASPAASAPAAAASSSLLALRSSAAPALVPALTVASPPNQLVGGLALPGRPPLGEVLRTSRLANAAGIYAQARAVALASGPDPSMNLRAEVGELMRLGATLNEFSEFGANVNTLKKDDRAWEFWETVCENLGTSPMRTAEDVRSNPDRQAFLLATLMLYASAVCIPKTPGRRCIKPRSALAYPLAIIRIFKRWGVIMPGYKALQAQLQGLQRAYLAYHGPKSLAPRRAEPMRFSMVRDINRIPVDGSVQLRGRLWSDSVHDVFMFRRLNLIMICGGWRLAEWVYHNSATIMYHVRGDLCWRINGRIVTDPTAAQLHGLQVGDAALLAPPLTKPDQTGEIHCPFPASIAFDHSPENGAAALRDIELRCPCHGAERATRPLIADAANNPYTHAVLDGLLYVVLLYLYGAAVAAIFSWHSYRAGLACALFAAGCPDAVIMLICRWICPDSLHTYRRIGTSNHAEWFQKAAVANVDSINADNVPRVNNDESFAEIFRDCLNPRQAFAQDWTSALGAAGAAQTAPPAPTHAPAAAAPAANTAPLTSSNAVGRRVLVPAELYPQYDCGEQGGVGWEALVVRSTATTAVVHYVSARTADGRPYADDRLPLSRLKPI